MKDNTVELVTRNGLERFSYVVYNRENKKLAAIIQLLAPFIGGSYSVQVMQC